MRKNYIAAAAKIKNSLENYESQFGKLPGVSSDDARDTLINQIIDSQRRNNYIELLRTRQLDPESANPHTPAFHPLKAAILQQRSGDLDEAIWMVFLYTHFGMHKVGGWRYAREVYGRLGSTPIWTWTAISTDVTGFRFWLHDNQQELKSKPGMQGFGNHRKYESLDAWSDSGTGAVIQSYVNWVLASGGHEVLFVKNLSNLNSDDAFDTLYKSMQAVHRFGRTARFDFLSTLEKLHLAPIHPPHSYIVGATGPLRGSRLLFTGDPYAGGTGKELQSKLAALSQATGITPDVVEDAICNWQKSPTKFISFQG